LVVNIDFEDKDRKTELKKIIILASDVCKDMFSY
jgi:hypothetical protein